MIKKKKIKKEKIMKNVELEKIKKIKVRLIGIGGGGGSIVSEIAQRVTGASFFAANTDIRALGRLSNKVKKFSFGREITNGLGTGMNPSLGAKAAENEKERIKKILEGQDLVILIACLGGGTGSGAAPVFAEISKNLKNLTYGIFTLPFKFEGGKKAEIGRNSLEKLKTELNAFSILPNERIFKVIDKSSPLKDALSVVNKSLADSIQSLIEIIYKPGLINIDFADFGTVFSGRGKLTYLNSIEGEGESETIVEKLINSPLYSYSIDGAKGVLFNISGRKDLSLDQVNQISKIISAKVHKNAKIVFGLSDIKKNGKFKVSLLATGCSAAFLGKHKEKPIKKPKKKVKEEEKKKLTKKPKTQPVVKKPTPSSPKKKKVKKIKVKINKPEVKISSMEQPKKEIKKVKIRKNALELKQEKEEEEKEIIFKEKFWETPSFLKKK